MYCMSISLLKGDGDVCFWFGVSALVCFDKFFACV